MHATARAACALPLILAQLALPAYAQTKTEPPPIVAPPPEPLPAEILPPEPDTLPPEPESPHPPAAAPAPTPPPPPTAAAPDYQAPPDYPLSMQILQAHLSYGWSPLTVSRGGIETPDLMRAVAGSERAENLVRAGQSQAATGGILSISGLVIVLGTTIVSIPVISSNNQYPYSNNDVALAGFLIGVLVGATLSAVGSVIQWNGYHQMVEGVNAYNADLLDGRLASPAALASQPR